MMTCPACKGVMHCGQPADRHVVVAGVAFNVRVEAWQCRACGTALVDDGALGKMELAIAHELGNLGRPVPEAFRYMRKALGLRALELALLLGVTPDTVSRWERGAVAFDRATFAVLAELVSEARFGGTVMRSRLETMHGDGLPAAPITLDVRTVVKAPR